MRKKIIGWSIIVIVISICLGAGFYEDAKAMWVTLFEVFLAMIVTLIIAYGIYLILK